MKCIDKIRQEIERLENEGAINKQKASENNDIESYVAWGQQEAVMGVLIRFIDSLQQEQPEVDCDELDEAAQAYANGPDVAWVGTSALECAFKAGAKWKYQKDRAEFAKLKAKEWMSGYDDAVSQFVKIPYEPRDWFSSGDGDFICGASFDEAIPADAGLYYRTKSEENESKN